MHLARGRVEVVEAAVGGDPQKMVFVFLDAGDFYQLTGSGKGIMGESFLTRVEPVERFVTSGPQISSVIFEEGAYLRASQARLVSHLMFVGLEGVAVVTAEAHWRGEPEEPKIVLHPGRRCGLRDSIRGR